MTRGRARSRLLGAVGAGTAVVLMCQPTATGAPPVAAAVLVDPGTATYVVQGDDLDEVAEVLVDLGVAPEETFDELGLLTVELAPEQLARLEAAPAVDDVSPEHVYSVDATQTTSTPWGLDRLDQATSSLDGRFTYDDTAGQGVRVYVVDTGVTGGTQLSGRLVAGTNTTGDANGTADCHGHGTHVAGTAAGTTFGIAKKATVVPVRVLGCTGGGTTSTVIAGLDWIAATHPTGTRGVVNLSLGGPRDAPLDAAVEELVQQGFVVVAAAGNETTDACTKSPAGAPSALTVGASDEHDARADFSNFGPCLDLFAPGNRIVSTSLTFASGAELRSGTSMAAPHVAGVAALVLGRHPGATPAQVEGTLLSAARPVVSDARSDTTGLLSSDVATLASGVPAPTGLAASSPELTRLALTWSPVDGASSYRLQSSVDGVSWTDVPSVSPSDGSTPVQAQALVADLAPGTTYRFRVAATVEDVSSPWSRVVTASTRAAPSGPRSTTISWSTPTRTTAAWSPPATSADLVTGYRVQVSRDGTSWSTLGTTTAGTRSFALSGMSATRTTWVRVAAMSSSTTTWARSITFTAPRASTRGERWVERSYRSLLGKSPDLATLTKLGPKATTESGRASVATSLTTSTTYRAQVVTGYFTDLLDRRPTSTQLSTWQKRLASGTSLTSVESQLLASSSHYALAGGTPDAWVSRAYQDALGRVPTDSERALWVPRASTATGRLQLATMLVASGEHLRPYVDGRYDALLGRASTATESQTWATNIRRGTPRERLDARILGGAEMWSTTP